MTKETKIEFSDSYLFDWEKQIFARHDNFEDYMFSIGVLSGKGGIKKVNEYRELDRKWNALQYARNRRDKANGYVGRKKWLDKLKGQFSKLSNKLSAPIKTDQQRLNEIETINVSEPKQGVNLEDIGF